MQRTFVFVMLIALLVLTPTVTVFAQDGQPEPVPDVPFDFTVLFEEMTEQEQLEFETAVKEMMYIVYVVQARQIAEQKAEIDEETLATEPEVPPSMLDEEGARRIIF
jgi:hypothetical protein